MVRRYERIYTLILIIFYYLLFKIEETLYQINTYKEAKGINILSNSKGIPIKSTMYSRDTN